MIILLLVVVAIGALGWYLLGKKQGDEQSPRSKQPDDTRNDEETSGSARRAKHLIAYLEQLVKVNIAIRKRGLAADLCKSVEAFIDKLRPLLEELNTNFVGNVLTVDVNKVASKYFPRLITEYLDLSPEKQTVEQDALKEALTTLEQIVAEAENAVKTQDEAQFAVASKLINAKFRSTSI